MIRKSVVAGQFYPRTKDGLKKILSRMIQETPEKQKALGLVMPHAGYIYSGSVAGITISKVDIPKTVIILGTNHTGLGNPFSIMEEGAWITPLGEVRIDREIAVSITKASRLIKNDNRAHIYEHSIEVEVPFLQYLREDIKIVPIIISPADSESYRDVASAVYEGCRKVGRPTLLIASSDFTHYEPARVAEEKDRLAISAILSLDEERLNDVVEKHGISMCGVAPVCVLIIACKLSGAKNAGLVKYQTSGDVTGDYSSVVGYAGIVIW